jgi:hypothetical protein
LARFVNEANSLRNEELSTPDDLSGWTGRVNDWQRRTEAWLETNLSSAEIVLFQDLSGMTAADVMGSVDRRHSQIRLKISRMITNLREILGQLQ